MVYLWDIFKISLRYLWDIFEISLGYLWDIFGMSLRYLCRSVPPEFLRSFLTATRSSYHHYHCQAVQAVAGDHWAGFGVLIFVIAYNCVCIRICIYLYENHLNDDAGGGRRPLQCSGLGWMSLYLLLYIIVFVFVYICICICQII